MASKKPKRGPKLPTIDSIDCSVRLPVETVKFFMKVSELSKVSPSDCINVALAIFLVNTRPAEGKEAKHEI